MSSKIVFPRVRSFKISKSSLVSLDLSKIKVSIEIGAKWLHADSHMPKGGSMRTLRATHNSF